MHGSESQMGNLFFIQPVWAIEVPSSCTCQWKHSSLAAKPNVQTTLYSLTFARLMSAFRTWKPIFLSFLGCTKFRQKVAWYIHIYMYIYICHSMFPRSLFYFASSVYACSCISVYNMYATKGNSLDHTLRMFSST